MQSSSNACCKAYFVPLCGIHCLRFLPFEEAKDYALSLKLANRKQWLNHCSEGHIPGNIPRNPDYVYKKDWKGSGDWLGTGRPSPKDRTFKPFHQARAYVHNLALKNKEDWYEYSKSRNRPHDIPSLPPRAYKMNWKGWGDWLGTGKHVHRYACCTGLEHTHKRKYDMPT